MTPRRFVRGRPARRNVDPRIKGSSTHQKCNPKKSQVEFNQAGKHRGILHDVADTPNICEFLRLNPPIFTGSSVTEDPKNFVEDL
ncbi:hypothetical protein H5410_020879 [Solanum commersonii]|uniref:Gag-pol polyprotein n=1 Tax=Solanum commersonii TaxID=4109 RepID=A0A9J5ZFJ3_SOLCO|nr:hypothetical protein H5410_020879 [Solanum commersonii]